MDQTKHLPFARSARPWLFLGLTLALTWLCAAARCRGPRLAPRARLPARLLAAHRRLPPHRPRLAAQPQLILPMIVWWFFFGPAVEEPGWRGYALDGLQARSGGLVATLVVGVAWAAWHLPLYFLAGTWQAETVGFATPMFWLVMGNILVGSLFYTWIYNNTARSTLAAILFHFSGNAFGELFALSPRAELYHFALGAGFAVLILLFWRGRTLTERRWGGAARRDDAGQAREPASRAAWPVLPNGTG
jgi:membrane protease YdiL (CAAX protease family)